MKRKHVSTSRLEIAYFEDGPADGSPVLLLHGFPDDATSWMPVMELLAAQGRRTLAPFIRGCGPNRFLNEGTPRAGDFAALGRDALEFVDALQLRDLTVVGQDWGSPTAEIVAIERPASVRRLVKLNWYGVYSMAEMAKSQAFSYPQIRTLWYVWLLQTGVGEMALRYDRTNFARALWEEWSPSWDPSKRQKALDSVAASFEGDDWLRVALSAYRNGITNAELDPADDGLRQKLKNPAPVSCDVVILRGADDGVERTPLNAEAQARYFPRGVYVESLPGVGHFPHREAPDAIAAAILGKHA